MELEEISSLNINADVNKMRSVGWHQKHLMSEDEEFIKVKATNALEKSLEMKKCL